MRCPKCGATMNRHAEKLVAWPDGVTPPAGAAFDGVLEAYHRCPACQHDEAVRATT